MAENLGEIALMGSGELTATMVEVHKSLISRTKVFPRAVFLDTPAGFQLNVDQLSERAREYFRQRIQSDMAIASLKSEAVPLYEAEKAYELLRSAGYILIGPGSPTYAVQQWRQTPVPDILEDRIRNGGCLVAASAAALTVGRCTLPVYEIYKVGAALYWEAGLDLLGRFGFNLVVIPHWNNAEGGTHDTRFCYMGQPRFLRLEEMLPDEVTVLGLDEHTACLLDLSRNEARIEGIGTVTLRRAGQERRFARGDRFSLDLLRRTLGADAEAVDSHSVSSAKSEPSPAKPAPLSEPFWDQIHAFESSFQEGLSQKDPQTTTHALLELDRIVWEAAQDLENPEFISQAREILRECIVLLGLRLKISDQEKKQILSSLIEAVLGLREVFRQGKRWQDADAIRMALHQSGIRIEDTDKGPEWELDDLE
jgi:peptidase E